MINKAIKIAQKGDWTRVREDFDDLETLVVTVGPDKNLMQKIKDFWINSYKSIRLHLHLNLPVLFLLLVQV